MARLLGGIKGVLCGKFSMAEQKESVLVPSSSMTPLSSFTGSLSVDHDFVFVFGGAPGSLRGSFQSGKPSPVGEIRTSCHPLSFEAYAPG